MLFAGLDDVVVESIAVGAEGWISGMSNAFPREGETLFRLAKQQRFDEAMALYRWFMPLLHLDARPDWCSVSSCAKPCWGVAVRLLARRVWRWKVKRVPEVVAIVEKALATRPALPEVGL